MALIYLFIYLFIYSYLLFLFSIVYLHSYISIFLTKIISSEEERKLETKYYTECLR
jgi:hypothetical protein